MIMFKSKESQAVDNGQVKEWINKMLVGSLREPEWFRPPDKCLCEELCASLDDDGKIEFIQKYRCPVHLPKQVHEGEH